MPPGRDCAGHGTASRTTARPETWTDGLLGGDGETDIVAHGPLGTKVATVTVAGTTWDAYEGNVGWQVHSFVRTSNTTYASLNLSDFANVLVSRGHINSSTYLSGVEAGTEVFHGDGRLDTNSRSVSVSRALADGPSRTWRAERVRAPGLAQHPSLRVCHASVVTSHPAVPE
ncbi:GH12 family glycosyl hydrolase domain-containing protein [Streptomyces sp. NPDC002845]